METNNNPSFGGKPLSGGWDEFGTSIERSKNDESAISELLTWAVDQTKEQKSLNLAAAALGRMVRTVSEVLEMLEKSGTVQELGLKTIEGLLRKSGIEKSVLSPMEEYWERVTVRTISAMDRHKNVVSIVEIGMEMVATLIDCCDFNIGFGRHLMWKSVTDAMNTYMSMASMQRLGCAALRKLGRKEENRQLMAKSDSLRTILRAMLTHCADMTVQIAGCDALFNLFHTEGKLTPAECAAAWDMAIRLVRPQTESAEVFISAFDCLGRIARQVTGLAAADVTDVLRLVWEGTNTRYAANTDVVVSRCNTLKGFAANESIREAMEKEETWTRVVCTMEAHMDNAAIVTAGCDAMYNMAFSHTIQSKMGAAAVWKTALKVMEKHNKNEDALESCCDLFRALAHRDMKIATAMSGDGVWRSVVAAMKALESSVAIQKAGCKALCRFDTEAIREEMGQASVWEVVASAMKCHPHEAKVLLPSLRFLAGHAEVDVNRGLMGKGAVWSAVYRVMDDNPESSAVQAAACDVLVNVASKNDQNRSAMIDACGHALAAMERHLSCSDVLTSACWAIGNLTARAVPNCQCVLALGGQWLIAAAMIMYSGDVEVQRRGIFALRNMWANSAWLERRTEMDQMCGLIQQALKHYCDDHVIQTYGKNAMSLLSEPTIERMGGANSLSCKDKTAEALAVSMPCSDTRYSIAGNHVLVIDEKEKATRTLVELVSGARQTTKARGILRIRWPTIEEVEIDGPMIKELTAANNGVPDEYICPLSGTLMEDPAVAADGISYERDLIERWLMDRNTSPVTGEPLEHRIVAPNTNLRIVITDFLARCARAPMKGAT